MKICPILSIGKEKCQDCEFKNCMLWNENVATCSITSLEDKLSIIDSNIKNGLQNIVIALRDMG